MRKNDDFDGQTAGQMTIQDVFTPPERLLAVSRVFARAKRDMTLAEQKAFAYALSELRFTERASSPYVKLDKKVLAGIIGIKSDTDHLSVDLYDNIQNLPRHSYIEINERDLDLQSSGFIITSITKFKNVIRIRFNEEYLGLFTGLTSNYITMWSSDIFGMQSRRSIQFYEHLRQNTDTREHINQIGMGIKALKELFGMPRDGDGSYMRKDGHFDRPSFERYVIDPICADLAKCRMISLIVQPDGKYYEKVKQGGRVLGYRFYWMFTSHPAVAAATEVQQIQERVDSNPEILKIAKDIVSGEKKKKKKENTFTAASERDYDWDDLEKKLLRAQEIPGQRSIEDYPEFMPE